MLRYLLSSLTVLLTVSAFYYEAEHKEAVMEDDYVAVDNHRKHNLRSIIEHIQGERADDINVEIIFFHI